MTVPTKPSGSVPRLFFPEDGIILPYSVSNARGEVVITLAHRAELDPILFDTRAYDWIKGVPGRVVVDVSRIQTMNTSCCGWLANLIRSAKPAPVVIDGATDQIAEVLRVLGLEVHLTVNTTATASSPGKRRRPTTDDGTGNP